MFQLDINTWIRFGIWLIIGYVVYFSYGIRHSMESYRAKLKANELENPNDKQTIDSKLNARPVEVHSMQSIDDLHNANIEFNTGSNVELSHQ